MNTNAHREFKDQLFRQLARVTKALSSPRRLELVDLLRRYQEAMTRKGGRRLGVEKPRAQKTAL